MRFIVVFSLVVLCQSLSFAQRFPSEFWHPGQVILTDESIRKGELKYDLIRQSVQIRNGDKTETYDASQIMAFSFVQTSVNALRTFYTIDYATNAGYDRPTFFEVFVEGKMTLFGREYEVTSSLDSNPARFNRFNSPMFNPFVNGTSASYLAFKLYFADARGRMIESTNRKKDILSYFEDKQPELKKYIKKEKLKLDDLADVAKLVRYYNNN